MSRFSAEFDQIFDFRRRPNVISRTQGSLFFQFEIKLKVILEILNFMKVYEILINIDNKQKISKRIE